KDINIAGSLLLGYQKSELLEMNFYDLLRSPRERENLQNRLLSSAEGVDLECDLITKNKVRKYCVLSLTRSGTDNDDPYFQGIIHDITNIKKAERETLQAEKVATTGRLVRTLSHEIRNPLTNIFLSVDQLQPEIRTSEGRK